MLIREKLKILIEFLSTQFPAFAFGVMCASLYHIQNAEQTQVPQISTLIDVRTITFGQFTEQSDAKMLMDNICAHGIEAEITKINKIYSVGVNYHSVEEAKYIENKLEKVGLRPIYYP